MGPIMERRDFILGIAGAAGAAVVRPLPAPAQAVDGPFQHGVASGDPLTDAVIIWTRVTTDADRVPVRWVVATDEALTDIVAEGDATADRAGDHTVKVDVTGLDAGTTYFYAFDAAGVRSPAGRTRTAPAGAAERLRIGLASCGRYATGWFNAYGRLAARDLDVVLHLGDYIYEDGAGAVRTHEPPRVLRSLDDYRQRYAQHRRDPDLQELHRRHPTVHVWDDHELAGNAWRAGARDHDDATDGAWAARLAAAAQAWREWLPVRLPDPADPLRIWRHLSYGGLAGIFMLDSRIHGRDQQVSPDAPAEDLRHPDRRLLGDAQLDWLTSELAASEATWKIIGNQVVFAPLVFPAPVESIASSLRERGFVVDGGDGFNPDQWDGYTAERDRFLGAIERDGVRNIVVASGDIHCSLVSDVAPGVTEVVTPSITSANFDELLDSSTAAALVETAVRGANPSLRFAEMQNHGYVVLDLTPVRLQADWWFVDTIAERSPAEHHGGSWVIDTAKEAVEETPEPVPEPSPAPSAEDDGDDDDLTIIAIGGAGTAAVAAGALIAFRRRRQSNDA